MSLYNHYGKLIVVTAICLFVIYVVIDIPISNIEEKLVTFDKIDEQKSIELQAVKQETTKITTRIEHQEEKSEIINIGEFIDPDMDVSLANNHNNEVVNIGKFIDVDKEVPVEHDPNQEIVNIGEYIDVDEIIIAGSYTNEKIVNIGEFISVDEIYTSKDLPGKKIDNIGKPLPPPD